MKLVHDYQLRDMTGVCSMYRLEEFGESYEYVRGNEKPQSVPASYMSSKNQFIKEIARTIRLDNDEDFFGSAMVMAVATNSQRKTQKLLRQVGFHEFNVPEYPKYAHGISAFIISTEELCGITGFDKDRKLEMEVALSEGPTHFVATPYNKGW